MIQTKEEVTKAVEKKTHRIVTDDELGLVDYGLHIT